MKILLCSIGTRGDVEPFLALGNLLKNAGHQVSFAFPEQFAALVTQDAPFFPFSHKFLELIESREGKIVMGGKSDLWTKLKAMYYLYRQGNKINALLVRQQFEIVRQLQPDKIIHNAKCSYPTLWDMQTNGEAILLSPVPYFMYYTSGHAHIGFRGNLGLWLNKLTYKLANFGLVKTISDARRSLPAQPTISKKEIRRKLFSQKLIYAISPSLFQKPAHWPAHVQVTTYLPTKRNSDWQAEASLLQFLEENPKCLLLTFGSMVNQDPVATSRLIYGVLHKLGIPTVVNTAAGGLLALEDFAQNPLFHFVETIPYDWIMPRVYAVVHHGGSGTTHLSLKNGCATLILPHILDQFAWNDLVSKKGAGPKGTAISKLDDKKLSYLLNELMLRPDYKQRAKDLSIKMKQEKGGVSLLKFVVGKR